MSFVRVDSTTSVYVTDGFRTVGDHLDCARRMAAAYETAQATLGADAAERKRLQRQAHYWLERATESLVALQRRAHGDQLTVLEVVDYARRMAAAAEAMTTIYTALATPSPIEERIAAEVVAQFAAHADKEEARAEEWRHPDDATLLAALLRTGTAHSPAARTVVAEIAETDKHTPANVATWGFMISEVLDAVAVEHELPVFCAITEEAPGRYRLTW
ncbi:hypothetical protein ACWF9G_22730 [Nocardia sp. NPDC055029]